MKYGFPGVYGCIDCTPITIVPPSRIIREENDYPEHKSCMLSLSSNVFPGHLCLLDHSISYYFHDYTA